MSVSTLLSMTLSGVEHIVTMDEEQPVDVEGVEVVVLLNISTPWFGEEYNGVVSTLDIDSLKFKIIVIDLWDNLGR